MYLPAVRLPVIVTPSEDAGLPWPTTVVEVPTTFRTAHRTSRLGPTAATLILMLIAPPPVVNDHQSWSVVFDTMPAPVSVLPLRVKALAVLSVWPTSSAR